MKICVFTATRAEYGIINPLLHLINNDVGTELQLFVTGTHMESEFGHTVDAILRDGFKPAIECKIIEKLNGSVSAQKTFAKASEAFAEPLKQLNPDVAVVVGDRYETLAFAISCMFLQIPLAHIHGGETSEGAIDENIRHSITKMSQLHFTSAEEHAKRVMQLGENPKHVWNVGAPGLDSVLNLPLIPRDELFDQLGLEMGVNLVTATLHPETNTSENVSEKLQEVFKSLDKLENFQFLWTKSNADDGGDLVNKELQLLTAERENHVLVDSLGGQRYFSCVKCSEFVFGNSSSGLIEAPALGVPTINIGDRQKGRLAGDSVINSDWSSSAVNSAIAKALSDQWKSEVGEIKSVYGQGQSSEKIFQLLKQSIESIQLSKKFFDWGE